MAQRLKMVCKKVMYGRRKRMKSLGNIKDELYTSDIMDRLEYIVNTQRINLRLSVKT